MDGVREVAGDPDEEAESELRHAGAVDICRENTVGKVRVGPHRGNDEANGARDFLCVGDERGPDRGLVVGLVAENLRADWGSGVVGMVVEK